MATPTLSQAADDRLTRSPSRAIDVAAPLLLALVAAITRLPLMGNGFGEADTARFVYGLRQWLHFGPNAQEIYGKLFSPAYYWLALHAVKTLHVPQPAFPTLLSAFSVIAAVLAAPLIYAIGRRLQLPAQSSFVAALLFLLSPAFWWLGFEPHPQGLSIAFFLLSSLLFLHTWPADLEEGQEALRRPRYALLFLSMLALSAGLLLKSDLVLVFAAFSGLLAYTHWRALRSALERRTIRGWLPAAMTTVAALAVASVLFLAGREAIVGAGFLNNQRAAGKAVGMFLEWPSGIELARQILPVVLGPGVLVLPAVLAGLVIGQKKRGSDWLLRWIVFIVCWSLPGYIFWFFIHGNNARHTSLYLLPLLWAGCEGWRLFSQRWLAAMCVAVLALDFVLIPPSSNLTLYPSGNVPVSAGMLHAREREMAKAAQRLVAEAVSAPSVSDPARPVAFFAGSYTIPYVVADVIDDTARRGFQPGALRDGPSETVYLPLLPRSADGNAAAARTIEFAQTASEAEFRNLVRQVPAPERQRMISFEYLPNGQKQTYLGSELTQRLHALLGR